MDPIEVARIPPFPSRQLVIAATNMLQALGHSGFDALLLELNLEDSGAGTGSGLLARATSLASFALKNPDTRTPEGVPLQSAIVARAGEIYRRGITTNISRKERDAFEAASATAGSMNDVTTNGSDPFFPTGVPVSEALSHPAVPEPKTPRPHSNKIFIVHGHEEAPRLAVARFLEHLGLQAIILHERANRGDTLIEKFEAHSDVDFAIVLLTPDDTVEAAGGTTQMRARQNVILEWGYFIAKLGRKNVVALRKGEVELPSDIHGIVWEVFDEHGAWRNVLARELAEVGFNFDWQKVVL